MPRTSEEAVIGVLGADYGPKPDGTLPKLKPYIDTANNVINAAVREANADGYSYDSVTLELMERWLAAHSYTKSDPTYSSRSTAGASGSFLRGKEEPEPYKDMVLTIDSLGYLNALLNRRRASAHWLGKVEDEMIPADERTG